MRHAVVCSNNLLCSCVRSNGDDLRFGKFCETVFFSDGMPLFAAHVGVVVCDRSEKKMVWINAARYIAPMKHAHALRYLFTVKPVGESMRTCLSSKGEDSSVSLAHKIAGPYPTTRPGDTYSFVRKLLKQCRCVFWFWSSFHDTLTVVIDGLRVSSAVTERRLQSLVPA